MTKRSLVYGLTIGLYTMMVLIVGHYAYWPVELQSMNMQSAERFIPSLSPKLQVDPRFRDVRLDAYTGQDGALAVSGEVGDEQACADLRKIVLDSRPPVPIAFHVEVWPPETQPATTRSQK